MLSSRSRIGAERTLAIRRVANGFVDPRSAIAEGARRSRSAPRAVLPASSRRRARREARGWLQCAQRDPLSALASLLATVVRGLRILGIDPGTNATGFGVVERDGTRLRHVAHGVLRPARAQPMEARLAEIHAGLVGLIAEYAPGCVAIEQIFVAASAKSALVLGQARGAALVAIGAAGLACEEIAPQQIKLAVVGHGAAEKAQVQAMVRRLLALDAPPARDASDALAAAICRAQMEGSLLRGAALAVRDAAASTPSEARRLWEQRAAKPRRSARAPRFVLRSPR